VALDAEQTISRRLTGEQRRQQLVEVAASLFSERGYRSTTMDDVAEAAGVTKPLLYQHFDSKKALYLELVDEVAHRMLAAVAEATSKAESPRQKVEFSLNAYFILVVSDKASFQLLYDRDHGGDEELGRAVRQVQHALVTAIEPLIDAGLDDNHRRFLASGMVGMAEGASLTWIESQQDAPPIASEQERLAEADRLARRLSSLMWAGLRSVQAD
jgi:AcrR family transcriptional regulator